MSAETTCIRLDVPVPAPARDIIEQAAKANGQTVSEFAASALVEKAEEVLRGIVPRPLSEADASRFLNLLDRPPAANDALKSAAARFALRHG
jgi:uncharacterized protein (DUF1778 family)